MSYKKFKLGFWHPLGPHAKESMEEIIVRKRKEIEVNGWTFWSFQFRPMLEDWHRKLSNARAHGIFVFCSEGPGAKDPAGTTSECKSYRFVGGEDMTWHPMPKGIRVPHPFRPGKKLASAFVVRRVIAEPDEPIQQFTPFVEWFSVKQGPWCQSNIPTRGVYLIRRGGTTPMRKHKLVLELKPPYLAEVNLDVPTRNYNSV